MIKNLNKYFISSKILGKIVDLLIKFLRKTKLIVKIKQNFFYKIYKEFRDHSSLKKWSVQDEIALKFYQQFLGPGTLCFDVGANIGIKSKILLKTGAKVIAVEPQKECVRKIEKYLHKNQLIILEKVLGESKGEKSLFICDINSMSSVSPDWINAVKESGRYSDKWWFTEQTVEVTTLDEMIKFFGVPDFIKIDVEGYELEVTKGLSRPVKVLSFEHTPELKNKTKAAFEHLCSLGELDWNYCVADTTTLMFDHWKPAREFQDFILDNSIPNTIGDIYIQYAQ